MTNLFRALAALVVLAIGFWLITAIERVDVEVPTPAHGEAARNERYVAQSLLRKLGATVVQHKSMAILPPVSGRLVLDEWDEDGPSDRAKRLHDWVEMGGQLAIPASLLDSESLATWLPVEYATSEASDEDDETASTEEAGKSDAPSAPPSAPAVPAAAKPVKPDPDRFCRSVTEPDTQPATYSNSRHFRLCTITGGYYQPHDEAEASWSVASEDGIELLRVPMGRGSVTVFDDDLLDNETLLRADHALLMAAALQARSGLEVWFLTEEDRESFSLWLWRHGWPATGLGVLALLLIWWRAGVRFGPGVAIAAMPRRSMREQVRGTAAFLRQRGSASLHEAQRRALDECVAQRLRLPSDWDDAQRASAIAQATGMAAQALARALHLKPAKRRRAAALAIDLQIMESARRRLLAGSAFASSPSSF